MNFGKIINVKIGDIQGPECITWSDEQIDMIEDVVLNYNSEKGLINISKDFKIIDGNHRLCILWEEYGDDYEIEVKQIPLSGNLYLTLLVVLLPIILPFGLIITTIKYIKNEFKRDIKGD